MIQTRVKVQLVAFLIISAVGIAYTGFTYVGVRPPGSTYTIFADFAESGGIFTNAEVTERGVNVGRVKELNLTEDGVRVRMEIESKWEIPKDSEAVVANLSAVGEQYVDIRPASKGGPLLRDGDVIPVERTRTPMEISQILRHLDSFIRSVDTNELATVLRELGVAFDNTGPDLRRLIEQGDKLTAAATEALPQTKALIRDGQTVLETQRQVGGDIRTFATNLSLLAQQLVTSDADLRKVLDNGVASSQVVDELLRANEKTLPRLLGNLVTLGEIQAARIPGLKTILVAYPPNVANGFFTAAGGKAHFGLVLTEEQPVCTEGYEGTTRHGNSSRSDFGNAANLNTYCNEPPEVTNARGSKQVPRPPGDDTANPPPGGYPPLEENPGNPPPSVATYDPATRELAVPGGMTYLLGDTGGQRSYLGSASWKWLLLAPAYG